MKKLIFTSSVCYCFSPLWFGFWLWIWGAFLVSFDLSLHWHHFFGAFLGTCPWSSLPLVHRARCERHCLFSISPLQLGLVFPAWKLCAPADFLLVSPQARAPVDGRSRSVLLPGHGPVQVSVVAGWFFCTPLQLELPPPVLLAPAHVQLFWSGGEIALPIFPNFACDWIFSLRPPPVVLGFAVVCQPSSRLCMWMLAGGYRCYSLATGSKSWVFLVLLLLRSWFLCHAHEVFDKICVRQFIWFWSPEFRSWLSMHWVLSSVVNSGS
jgi:hypothetical protein